MVDVIDELIRDHRVAEETFPRPAARQHAPDGRPSVDHHPKDYREQIMKELEGEPASDPRFTCMVRQLTAHLRHHAAEEERERFRAPPTALPSAVLAEPGGKVAAARRLAPTRPHPRAPRAEVSRRFGGPGIGLVDRPRGRSARCG